MSATTTARSLLTTTTQPLEPHGELPAPGRATPQTLRQRLAMLASSALAGLLGIMPHVLHHAGPLAGAALFAGAAGTLIFGAIGFVAAIPFLLRLHRRHGNWRVPAALLVLFAVVFSISTFVIGPAMSGNGSNATSRSTTDDAAPGAAQTKGHDAHHN